jgi:predicted  nucleic acid-binding Zn-ribbon protein
VPPVEIEVIKYVDREVIKEVPVEKVVSNIDNISDKYDEKIFHLNEELEQERRKFSIKLTDLENIFHKEKNELLSQIDKLNEDKTNDKSKMLENTLLNLRKELHLKQTKINELEDKIKQLEEQLSKNVNAFYLKGSNLNQRI